MKGTFVRPALLRLALMLVAVGVLVATLPTTRAQSEVRYFPETGHTLRGAFRSLWEANGALEIFGYPLTEEFAGSGGRLTQWFERARFEIGEVGGRPQVQLGLLGIEATQGRIFPKVPPITNTADQRYIPETQHIIQYGFKEIWETRGDLRIFGFPISEEIDEVLDDGEWHTVQYFERSRFEYWPDRPEGQRVLISLLGRKLAPPERTAPVPQPGGGAPTAQPQPQPQGPVPASVNAAVSPQSGPPGTTFSFDANGFEAGEQVGIWLTAPDQSTFGADFQATADNNGSIAGARIGLTTDASYGPGIWSFNAQGVRSKRQAIGYFRIVSASTAGDPGKLALVAHDQLTRQGQASILPAAAPPGFTFYLLGAGFAGDEGVSAWVTDASGKSTPIDAGLVQREGDSVEVLVGTAGLPEGIYTAVAQGQQSQVIAAASFKLTRDYVAGPGTARPGNVNGSANPAEATPGTVVQIRGQGLRSGEQLDFWITDPSGAYVLFPDAAVAEGDGRIGYNPSLDLQVTGEALSGVYGIHFRGRASGARVDLYFTVSGTARGLPGRALWVEQELAARGFVTRLR